MQHARTYLSESALSEGTPPVWPWRGVWDLAGDMSGASGSRSSGLIIGRAVGHHLHEVCSLFAPPHDDPPSLAGEGDPIPSARISTKASTLPPKHMATRQGRRKAHGGGKRSLHLACFEGGGSACGGLPIPLSGA
eukprot:scaffold8866_cov96-Isochrysis_galbana.AAC.3